MEVTVPSQHKQGKNEKDYPIRRLSRAFGVSPQTIWKPSQNKTEANIFIRESSCLALSKIYKVGQKRIAKRFSVPVSEVNAMKKRAEDNISHSPLLRKIWQELKLVIYREQESIKPKYLTLFKD